jgi:uncharacterized membrane protein
MLLTPLLLIHICCATVGLLSGFMAMALRKGSGLHSAAGNVFFVSMLIMSSTAAYIAMFLRPIMINVIAGLLTFYLVSTGRRAAKQRAGGTGLFDYAALLFVLAVGIAGVRYGFAVRNSPNGMKDGIPVAMYFVFGSIALLFAVSDVRMLVRGGVIGAQRLGRHLWRMSLALLIATMSFYPGQAKLFSKPLRQTNLLWTPHVLLIGAVLLWLIRISIRKRAQRRNVPVLSNSAGVAEAV